MEHPYLAALSRSVSRSRPDAVDQADLVVQGPEIVDISHKKQTAGTEVD